ncbi:MAG: immune inhibitor A domain-containing protein [Myxococcota bacterium]
MFVATAAGCPLPPDDEDPDAEINDAVDSEVSDDVTGDSEVDTDADAGPQWPTQIESPGDIFVGSYQELEVTLDPNAAYTFDDLEFEVPSGNRGGSVSYSRTEDFDPTNPTIMFLAGWMPGDYTLEAYAGGQKVSETKFTVTTDWPNRDQGPPMWLTGDTRGAYGTGGFAFGGGNPGVESYGFREQTGTRDVLLLFVEFDNADFSGIDVDDAKQNWMDHAQNGILDPNTGNQNSAAEFWSEVSGGRLSVNFDVVGPVDISGDMEDWWVRKDWRTDLGQAAVSKVLEIDEDGDDEPDVDLTEFDSIVFVAPTLQLPSQPACQESNDGEEICDGRDNDCDGDIDAKDSEIDECNSDPECGDGEVDPGEACDDGNDFPWDYCDNECNIKSQHYPWPRASGATLTINDGEQKRFGVVQMPEDWGDGLRSNRAIYETLAHELGHNLGLPDLYDGDAGHVRPVDDWTMMASDWQFPHITASERYVLGWIDEDQIFTFNPGSSSTTSVTLSPIETLSSGETTENAALEVRLADGWNYYFEYRLGQSGQIADRRTPIPQPPASEGTVIGTDHNKGYRDSPVTRRRITMVPVDPNFDGPDLDVGEEYRRRDWQGDKDFKVAFTSGDTSQAVLDVDYGVLQPDPSIRTWPDGDRRWQSPDIRVENAKNDEDAENSEAWENIPWAEHNNTIVATVRNNGSVDAPGTTVRFYAKDFTTDEDGPATFLGSETADVAVGSEVDFEFSGWRPPSDGHYCVVAEIDLYQNQDTFEVEMTERNNRAQSNYSAVYSVSSSPATREKAYINVRNPYEEEAVVFLDSRQTHDHFRTYISSRWVRLNPNETRQVPVMFEYSEDFTSNYREFEEYEPRNEVEISAWAVDPSVPFYGQERTPQQLAGANFEIRAGYETEVDMERIPEPDARELNFMGVVRNVALENVVTRGEVMVTIRNEFGSEIYRRAAVNQNGVFELDVFVEGNWVELEVEYLGSHPFAPSDPRTFTP